MKRTLAVLLSLALLVSTSAFAATLTDASKFNQLQAGKTTAAQTIALLGKPNQENRSPDGRYAYMYEFDLPNKADPSKPPVKGVAAMMFSPQDVLLEVQLLKKAGQ